jgi:peptide/nickel transport system permease protein
MGKLLGQRLLLSLTLVILIPTVTFVLEALTPGSIVDAQLGVGAAGPGGATDAQRAQIEHQLGLDQSLGERWLHWFTGLLHGDLGTSWESGQSVTSELNNRLPVTLSVVVLATILTAVVGILIGVLTARRTGRLSSVVNGISVLGVAVPNFWLAVLLVNTFAVSLAILPATGYITPGDSVVEWARSLVLPVLALAFAGVTTVAKQTRDQMKDVLDRDFVRQLRANGVGESSIVYRHALRAASVPVVTVIGLLFVGALAGAVVVENIFVMPGLGSAAVQATMSHDTPVILGIAVYFTALVVVANIVVDVVYGWLNPRIRTSA